MAKEISLFECQLCGTKYPKWLGKCESCQSWNSLEEIKSIKSTTKTSQRKTRSKPIPLKSVESEDIYYYETGIKECDDVLGKGLVKGAVVLLGGEPGVGKSTLSLQLCQNLATKGQKVLYVSSEESESQVKLRAERLGPLGESLWVYAETDMQAILNECESLQPDIILLDSIQAVYHPELTSLEGTVSQVRHCANCLISWVKSKDISAIMIGHITKEGHLAGPKTLEHMVDVIMYLEGDRHYQHRILRCYKNRYGSTDPIGLFEMKGSGLVELSDPSQCFIQGRGLDAPGSVIVPYSEGSRIILVEVQALVVESGYGIAKRNFVGVDPHRANLIIAALDKLFKFKLAAHDVFLTIIGGLKVSDPSIDLAIIVAIVSSLRQHALPEKLGVIGEVGLTGEIRPVPHIQKRVEELKKCGFTHCIIPKKNNLEYSSNASMQLQPADDLTEVLTALFLKKKEHAHG